MCLIQESGTLHEDSGVAYCCHLISMTYLYRCNTLRALNTIVVIGKPSYLSPMFYAKRNDMVHKLYLVVRLNTQTPAKHHVCLVF